MRRIAIYVEGDAELIFVREFLIKWYEYDSERLGLECCKLHAGREDVESYPYGTRKSENFYYIVNVGNDASVMSKMLKNAERLHNLGYQLLIGLRDMYCDDYHDNTQKINNARIVDIAIIERFKKTANEIIANAGYKIEMQLHYAIMEIEAWLIGMSEILNKDIDPENDFYHPSKMMTFHFPKKLDKYDKHHSEIEKVMSEFTKEDFQKLIDSGICASFSSFARSTVF